jgi:hypothetical protein
MAELVATLHVWSAASGPTTHQTSDAYAQLNGGRTVFLNTNLDIPTKPIKVVSREARQIRRKDGLMDPARNAGLNPCMALRSGSRKAISRGLECSSQLVLVLEAGFDPVVQFLVQAVHLLEDQVIG